jgi:UPF0755 protein
MNLFGISKKTAILFGGGLLLAAAFVGAVPFFPNGPQEPTSVRIPRGAPWEEAVDSIRPTLRFPVLFRLWSSLKNPPDSVPGGHYVLESSEGSRSLYGRIAGGWEDPVRISFNSVDNFGVLASKLGVQLDADSASFDAVLQSDSFWVANGNIPRAERLAAFVPNSFEVYWSAEPEQVLVKLLEGYEAFWTSERKTQAQAQGLTPVQVATLASIVQKETAKGEEMPRVAGLYLNRLRQGIKLQSDPTVIYAYRAWRPQTKPVRRVLNYMLRAPGPYNTYQVMGLPPGPIAVPEIQALQAVLQAEKHRYLYMCADPNRPGFHRFALTDVAHEKNRLDYIAWLNRRKIYR